jgi:phenylacetate-CoA ligase
MSGMWNPEAETMTSVQIRIVQTERLRRLVRQLGAQSKCFNGRFAAAGIDFTDFVGLDDIERLPFSCAELAAGCYPLCGNCTPEETIREVHTRKGTRGMPVAVPYTESDIRQWAHMMARCFYMAGASKGDVVQILADFNMYDSGFGFFHGASLGGLAVLPTGPGDPEEQVSVMKDFNVNIVCAPHSKAMELVKLIEKNRADLPALSVGIFDARNFQCAERQEIRERLDIDTYFVYGTAETGGVGSLGMECPEGGGVHVWEDHYYLEVIEAGSDRVLEDGEEGELVISTLTREALPMLRFRTGCKCRVLSREPCVCGRSHVRIEPLGNLD